MLDLRLANKQQYLASGLAQRGYHSRIFTGVCAITGGRLRELEINDASRGSRMVLAYLEGRNARWVGTIGLERESQVGVCS